MNNHLQRFTHFTYLSAKIVQCKMMFSWEKKNPVWIVLLTVTVSNEKRTPNYFMFGARLQLFVTFNSVTQIDLTPNAAVTPDETQRSGEIRQYFMKTLQINVASVTFFFFKLACSHHATTHSSWSDAPPTVWTLQGSSPVLPVAAQTLTSPSWAWHADRSGNWLWTSAIWRGRGQLVTFLNDSGD